jgi:hypothetical protein
VSCIVAAGCGGAGKSSSTSATQGSGSTHTAVAAGPITRARAVAYAQAVNLMAADVPGAKITKPEHQSAAPSPASVQYTRCAGGVSPARKVADIDSATFRTGTGLAGSRVKSSVTVLPSAALATRNFAAARSPQGRRCLATLLPQALENNPKTRGHFAGTSTSALPSPLPTGTQSFGVRVATTFTSKSAAGRAIQLPIYIDEFVLLAGAAEVNLSAFSLTGPVPTAGLGHLLSLLNGRAQANKLQ